MEKKLIDEMFETEETYWWHVAKRKLILENIQTFLSQKTDLKILDVGCGTGAMMSDIKKLNIDAYGIDGSKDSLRYSKSRGHKNVQQADFEKKLPYKSNFFDACICLDVLEHISNDENLLKEFHRILKPGGKVFLTVPAYMALWTYWDVMLGHMRRYRKSNLLKLFTDNNLNVLRSSYFYSFLLPVAFVFRHIKSASKKNSSDFVKVSPALNVLLLGFCRIERLLIRFITLPFGLSILIVGEKNE